MSDEATQTKTITIEYLGTRGNPITIPATRQGTWFFHSADRKAKTAEHGDASAEPEEIARELIEQGGFREVKPPAAEEPKSGNSTKKREGDGR